MLLHEKALLSLEILGDERPQARNVLRFVETSLRNI